MRCARLLSVVAILLTGCVPPSIQEAISQNSAAVGQNLGSSNRSLYGIWEGVADPGTVDLTSYRAPATQTMTFQLENDQACECVATSSAGGGGLRLSQCRNSLGSTGELGCSTFAGQYTITQSASGSLEICDAQGACSAYH